MLNEQEREQLWSLAARYTDCFVNLADETRPNRSDRMWNGDIARYNTCVQITLPSRPCYEGEMEKILKDQV